MKPTFIGIGAQKCASTWLYRILAEHPEVGVSEEKEIHFFSHWYDRGYQWYERHFEGNAGKQVVGEISPSYFVEPTVPKRVFDYDPNLKILVSFRHPIQRALSNHRHEVRAARYRGPDFSFEAGMRNNPMYVEQGRYGSQLERWLEYFPASQFLFVFMEDVESAPLQVAKDVFAFLGVDQNYVPQGLETRFNPSYANRYHWLVNVKDAMYRMSQLPGGALVWKFARSLGLRGLYRNVNWVNSEEAIPAALPETIEWLRQEYSGEITKLESLTGRSLAGWR
jgi:hypothetical protein